MNDEDLKALGDVLGQGQAGLIVVHATNMADQIAANVKAVNKQISKETDANADELAKEPNQVGAAS
jgi:ABC-type polar amino acid transport system ATPase subunit